MDIPTINSAATRNTLPYLTFSVAERSYCFPIHQVVRIIEMVTITPLPAAPKSIQGIINLHGKAVPVMDLRQRLELPPQAYGLDTPIILVEVGDDGHLVGIIVDEVEDVLHLTQEHIPSNGAATMDRLGNELIQQPTCLKGIATVEGRMILILDPGALLSGQDQQQLGLIVGQEIQFSL